MSEIPHSTADDSEATDARFSVRALFKTMAAIAVVAAVLGPVVRQFDPNQQRRLLFAWGVWLTAAMLWIGFQARRRFEAERMAGRTIVPLPMFDERLPGMTRKSRYVDCIGACLLALLGLTVISMEAVRDPITGTPVSTVLLYICGAMSIAFVSRGVFSMWWRRSIRFCNSGILWDRTLLPWTHVICHRWSDSGGILELCGSDQRGAEIRFQLAVPPGRRDTVQRLLAAKSPERPSVAAIDAGTSNPNSESQAKSQRTSRKIVTFASRIVLAIGTFYLLIFAGGSQGAAGFYNMLIATLVGGSLVHAVQGTRIAKLTGAPLVRLDARIDWRTSLAVFAVSVGCYLVSTSYAWTRPWLAGVSGLGCGLAFILSVYGESSYFELREGGVLYPGRFLWPWSSIRLIHWDRDGAGRLVLGRGWRRIVVQVPPEQRSAVDEVLAQKFGPAAVTPAPDVPT